MPDPTVSLLWRFLRWLDKRCRHNGSEWHSECFACDVRADVKEFIRQCGRLR
jgi:hypothetical protein